MRKVFAEELYKKMILNEDIILIVGDLGYGLFDSIRKDFPKQFINAGAAEQTMMGIGVGVALSDKIPVVYSITPFLLYRPFETIRNYVDREKIPVKMVGSGRDKDYEHDGFSHWAEDDRFLPKVFKNIDCIWPTSEKQIPSIVDSMLFSGNPCYLNLKR